MFSQKRLPLATLSSQNLFTPHYVIRQAQMANVVCYNMFLKALGDTTVQTRRLYFTRAHTFFFSKRASSSDSQPSACFKYVLKT